MGLAQNDKEIRLLLLRMTKEKLNQMKKNAIRLFSTFLQPDQSYHQIEKHWNNE